MQVAPGQGGLPEVGAARRALQARASKPQRPVFQRAAACGGAACTEVMGFGVWLVSWRKRLEPGPARLLVGGGGGRPQAEEGESR